MICVIYVNASGSNSQMSYHATFAKLCVCNFPNVTRSFKGSQNRIYEINVILGCRQTGVCLVHQAHECSIPEISLHNQMCLLTFYAVILRKDTCITLHKVSFTVQTYFWTN